MFHIEGTYLSSREVKATSGKTFRVHSILDEYPSYAQVVEVVDFDGNLSGVSVKDKVQIPVSVRLVTAKSGRVYPNYTAQGAACHA